MVEIEKLINDMDFIKKNSIKEFNNIRYSDIKKQKNSFRQFSLPNKNELYQTLKMQFKSAWKGSPNNFRPRI